MGWIYNSPEKISSALPYSVISELYEGYLERGGPALFAVTQRTPLDFPLFMKVFFYELEESVRALLPQFINTSILSHTMRRELQNWTEEDFYALYGGEPTGGKSFRPLFSVDWVFKIQTMLDVMSCKKVTREYYMPKALKLRKTFDSTEEALAWFAASTPELSGYDMPGVISGLYFDSGQYWLEYLATKMEGVPAYNIQSLCRRETGGIDLLGYLEEPEVRYLLRNDRLVRNDDGTLDYYCMYPHTAVTPAPGSRFVLRCETLLFFNFEKSSGNQMLAIAPPQESETEDEDE